MNLQELRDVQNRERTTDSLQELPDSFYADVAEYIQELKDERQRVADEVDNPWDSSRISQLSDEIESAEQVAEAVYERRVGKVVKQASFAAADIASEDGGLTAEERDLYDDLVDRITENKGHVLDVLGGAVEPTSTAGAGPDATNSATDPASATGDAARDSARAGPPTDAEPAAVTDAEADAAAGPPETASEEADADSPAVDAADLMGDGASAPDSDADAPSPTSDGPDAPPERPADDESADDDAAAGTEDGDTRSEGARRTVRITRDVGEIYGVDERVYTLEAEDVVDLPEENAAPLVERDAAERL